MFRAGLTKFGKYVSIGNSRHGVFGRLSKQGENFELAVTMNGDNGDVKKYTTKQVADLLNIDKSTLLRWIRQQKIEDVLHRDGRGWRVWLSGDVARVKEYHDSIHSLTLNLTFDGAKDEKDGAAQ
jgi:excisionase family DNA binding protein